MKPSKNKKILKEVCVAKNNTNINSVIVWKIGLEYFLYTYDDDDECKFILVIINL